MVHRIFLNWLFLCFIFLVVGPFAMNLLTNYLSLLFLFVLNPEYLSVHFDFTLFTVFFFIASLWFRLLININYGVLLNLKIASGINKKTGRFNLIMEFTILFIITACLSLLYIPDCENLLWAYKTLLTNPNNYTGSVDDLIPNLFRFLAFLACCISISYCIFANTEKRPIVLFLRKFKSKGDYVLPNFICSVVGDKYRLVSLSSKYVVKTLFLITDFSQIPLYRRVLKPFSYVLEFYHSYDDNWENVIEQLIEEASYIFIDITKMSKSIISEAEMLIMNEKQDVTYFIKAKSRKDDEEEPNWSILEDILDVKKRTIYVSYPFIFRGIKKKRKLRKKIRKLLKEQDNINLNTR